jgi:hypothetical protein
MSGAAFCQAGEPKASQDRASQVEKNQDSTSQSGTGPARPSDNGQGAVAAPQVPPYVIYRFFFLHLDDLDQVALQEEARGNSGEGWRSHEERAAQLNEEEGKILKQVAYDCNKALRDLDEKAKATIAASRAQDPNGKSVNLPLPPELVSLQDEQIAIVNSSVDDLRVKLGADSFKKLDDYIQTRFKTSTQPASTSDSKRPGGAQ